MIISHYEKLDIGAKMSKSQSRFINKSPNKYHFCTTIETQE